MSKLRISLILAGVTLALFAPAIWHGFLGYDDPDYITTNPHVRAGLTLESMRWSFRGAVSYWHPLTWMSHMLDVQVFGLAPAGHHAVSIALHSLGAVILFLALNAFTGATWRSALASAIWAWHPLRVESVVWAAERKDVLSGALFLATIFLHARYAKRPSLGAYLLVAAGFALALMAKPMVVTLPLVLLILDFWPLRRFNRRAILEKLPLLGLSIGIAAFTIVAQRRVGALGTVEQYPLIVRLKNVPVAYVRYLFKIFCPVDLAVFYPYHNWPMLIGAGALVLLTVITIWTISQRNARPYLLAGWLWFIVTLLPVIGFVQAGSQSMADRYSYLPQIGILIMVVWGAGELATKHAPKNLAIAGGAVLACCAVLTLLQIRHWQNDFTLFSHALEVTDDNWLAHGYVGVGFASKEPDKAVEHYAAALEIEPHFAEAHYNWANLLYRRRQYAEAIEHYNSAIALRSDFGRALMGLGAAQATLGDRAAAEKSFERAVKAFDDRAAAGMYDPERVAAENNLAIIRKLPKRD